MSSHRSHKSHTNDLNENNTQSNKENIKESNNVPNNGKSNFDINGIAELINSIKPEELSALIAKFNVEVRKLLNK